MSSVVRSALPELVKTLREDVMRYYVNKNAQPNGDHEVHGHLLALRRADTR